MPGIFADRLEEHADRVALVSNDGETVSYTRLAELADGLLEGLGSRPRLVLIEARNDVATVSAYSAALRGRHPVILASPGAADGRIAETFRPSAVFRAGTDAFEVLHDEDPELHPDLAVLLSTSGSTGSAKLVKLSRANIEANAASIAEYLGIDDDEVAPTSLPLHYSYGLSVLNSHLRQGARVVLTESSVIDPAFRTLFDSERCTSLAGVPHVWELLERAGFLEQDWPTLKTMTQAGGRLSPAHVVRFGKWARERGKRFFVMYGQTEATARMSYLPPELLLEHADCMGVAIPGGRFELVDESGTVLDAPTARGELVYYGPNVMMGYAREPSDLATQPGPAVRRTADLAERLDNGLYRIVGRLARFSKIVGLRISLDEVESSLARDGISAKVAGNDERLAICVLEGTGRADEVEADVATRCGIPRETIVAFEHPQEFPRLPSGKVDYVHIRERAAGFAEQRGHTSGGLRVEIATILGLPTLTDGDTFSLLGGDSLSYVQVSFVIEKHLGHLPPEWEAMPIEALESRAGGAASAVFIDTEVVLRAIAITAVVLNHALPRGLSYGGGATALLLLAGVNLARFRSEPLFRGEGLAHIRSIFGRYVLPYYAVLVAYLVAKRQLDIPSLLLVSNFFTMREGTFLAPFWFLEVFVMFTSVVALALMIGPVQRAARARPLASGGVLFAALAGLHLYTNLVDVGLPPVLRMGGLFAFGWCLHFARSTRERIMLSLVSLALPWLVPNGLVAGLICLVLIWVPRVPILLRPLKRGIGEVSAATFYIYIGHTIVLTALGSVLGLRESWVMWGVGIPVSLGLGVAVVHALGWFASRRSRRNALPADAVPL